VKQDLELGDFLLKMVMIVYGGLKVGNQKSSEIFFSGTKI